MRDTPPDSLARYCELLRAQKPHERLQQAVSLTRSVRELAIAGLRQRYPSDSEGELRARFVACLYGREIAERLCGVVSAGVQ